MSQLDSNNTDDVSEIVIKHKFGCFSVGDTPFPDQLSNRKLVADLACELQEGFGEDYEVIGDPNHPQIALLGDECDNFELGDEDVCIPLHINGTSVSSDTSFDIQKGESLTRVVLSHPQRKLLVDHMDLIMDKCDALINALQL